jgi:hypothetical protein
MRYNWRNWRHSFGWIRIGSTPVIFFYSHPNFWYFFQFYSSTAIQAYTSFCLGREDSNRQFNSLMAQNQEFRKFIEFHQSGHKDRSFKDCILLIAQRLTKYPVLVEQVEIGMYRYNIKFIYLLIWICLKKKLRHTENLFSFKHVSLLASKKSQCVFCVTLLVHKFIYLIIR